MPSEPTLSTDARSAVLLVEDDAAICMAVSALLDSEGYRTVVACTLDEARASLRTERIDVVILDLALTAERGDVLLEEMSASKGAPPVIIVSSSITAIDTAAKYSLRSVGKPFDAEQLLTVLRLAQEDAAAAS